MFLPERLMEDNVIRILLVEDDIIDQLAFKRFIQAENLPYQASVTTTIAEARHILESQNFDIIVTDYELSDGNVFDIFALIVDTPVIVVTAGGDEKIAIQTMKVGAYDYLIKDLERNYLRLLPVTVNNAIAYQKSERHAKMLSHAMMNINESVCITDKNGKIIFINKAFSQIYGYEPQEVMGKSYELFGGERMSLKTDEPCEFVHQRKGGKEVPVSLSRSVLQDDNGSEIAVVEVVRDVTKRRQAEQALQYRVRFEKVITTLSTLFIYLSPDEIDSGINIALQTIGEFTQADLSYVFLLSEDQTIIEDIYKWDASGVESQVNPFKRLSTDCLPWSIEQLSNFEDICIHRLADLPSEAANDHHLFQTLGLRSMLAVPMVYGHALIGILGLVSIRAEKDWSEDVVSLTRIVAELFANAFERKRSNAALHYQAFHDALTGLPNRALFAQRLASCIERSKSQGDYLFAVLFLDLDRFKVINDSLGHQAGDHLLITTARRLEACVRAGDTVARLGGDEFVVLLAGLQDVSDATYVADRIQEKLALPIGINGHQAFTTASIGIFLSSLGGYTEPRDILRDADVAMYQAKIQGKAHYQIFDVPMREQAVSRLNLEAELRQAVERQEFQVFYQPIVSLASGRISGVEALVRWQHPKRGLLSPPEFIPLAEETGLIIPIGEWVLHTACVQNEIWHLEGYSSLRLRIAVNISVGQFQQQNLLEMIRQTINEANIPPGVLELEITEEIALMKDFEASLAVLNELKSMGIRISIDDMGIGYSSLRYLKYFAFDSLKIDRSFIHGITSDSRDQVITTQIIAMAQSLDLNVVAEGVERADQLTFLKSKKCDEIQGYLFSRPLPSEKMTQLLRDGYTLGSRP